MTPASLAYIGIGANLGDAHATVLQALDAVSRLPQSTLVKASSLYRTAPVDAGGDDYINAVASLHTTLTPLALLHALQAIELEHGRQRPYRNAPRTLDLDLLLYDKLRLDSAELTLPHPRMHQRAFVLAPLIEISPAICIDDVGLATDLLAHISDQPIHKL